MHHHAEIASSSTSNPATFSFVPSKLAFPSSKMLRRRKVESKKQYKKRLRRQKEAAAKSSVVGSYKLSNAEPPGEPIDCVVSNDEKFLQIYDKQTCEPVSRRPRFQKRRRDLFERVDIAIGSPATTATDNSSYYGYYSDEDDEESPLTPPGSTPHGRKLSARGGSPPGRRALSKRRATFELASLSVENSILDHQEQASLSPKKQNIISNNNPKPVAPASAPARQENTTPWVSDPLPETTESFACCDFLQRRSEPPGITIAEEQRLWREAIEQKLREEQTARRKADTSRDVDQIEVVPVDRSFQAGSNRAHLKYAEMDGVGMVFASADIFPKRRSRSKSPAKEPTGRRSRGKKKPWWEQESWTDSSFHDTSTDMQEKGTGYSADHVAKYSAKRVPRCASEPHSRHEECVQSPSLLEQSREARAKTYQQRGLGLHVDTSEEMENRRDDNESSPRRSRTSHTLDQAGNSQMDRRHVSPNSLSPSLRPQYRGVANSIGRLSTQKVSHANNANPCSPSLLQQAKMSKALRKWGRAENQRQSPEPHIEDLTDREGSTSLSDLDESLDQRIARLDHLKKSKRQTRSEVHYDRAEEAKSNRWVACHIYDAIPGNSDIEDPALLGPRQLSSLAIPQLNHGNCELPIEAMMNQYDTDLVVGETVQNKTSSNISESDLSSVVERMEMATRRTPKACNFQQAERRVEIRELPKWTHPGSARQPPQRFSPENSELASPVILRGRPPYFGTKVPNATSARISKPSSAGRSGISPKRESQPKQGSSRNNENTSIWICMDSDFQEENEKADDTEDSINDSCRYLDPRPQKMKSPPGRRNEPIKLISPVGFYGDPPVLRKTDGSPISKPGSSFPHNHRTGEVRAFDPETESDTELDIDGSNVEEFQHSKPKLMELMETLSPKKGKHGAKDSSGVLLFRPTINIYGSRSETMKTKSPQGNTPRLGIRDQNEVGFGPTERLGVLGTESPLREMRASGVHNKSPAQRSQRRKPNLYIRTTDSECENVEFPRHFEERKSGRGSEDDDNMHMELEQLADSEIKLRKELEQVQQRSAEYRWISQFPNSERLTDSTKLLQQKNKIRRTTEFANSDDDRKRAMNVPAQVEMPVRPAPSDIIDLSYVDENPTASGTLRRLTQQISPRNHHFAVANPYTIRDHSHLQQGARETNADRENQPYFVKDDLEKRDKSHFFVSVNPLQPNGLRGAWNKHQSTRNHPLQTTSGEWLDDEIQHAPYFRSPRNFSSLQGDVDSMPEERQTRYARNESYFTTTGSNSQSERRQLYDRYARYHRRMPENFSRRDGVHDKIRHFSLDARHDMIRSPNAFTPRVRQNTVESRMDYIWSSRSPQNYKDKVSKTRDFADMESTFYPPRCQFGFSPAAGQLPLDNEVETLGDELERNSNILIDRELSWGAVENLYQLSPPRGSSDIEAAVGENDNLVFDEFGDDDCRGEMNHIYSRDARDPPSKDSGGDLYSSESMTSGDARLLALLSRYHSPEELEQLVKNADTNTNFNAESDNDTPPTSNTAHDPVSVHRRNLLLVRHGFKQNTPSGPTSSRMRSPAALPSGSPMRREPSRQIAFSTRSSDKENGTEHTQIHTLSTKEDSQEGQHESQQVFHDNQIDTQNCLSPSTLCMSPGSRLERLRRLQSKMTPGNHGGGQSPTTKRAVEDLTEEAKTPAVPRRLLTGARQRASRSLRHQKHLNSVSATRQDPKSPTSPSNDEVLQQTQRKAKNKNYGGRISRDIQSIASSTDRSSKDLIHSMSSTARSRNAAAAKPGR